MKVGDMCVCVINTGGLVTHASRGEFGAKAANHLAMKVFKVGLGALAGQDFIAPGSSEVIPANLALLVRVAEADQAVTLERLGVFVPQGEAVIRGGLP